MVKVISLSNEPYSILKGLKVEKESFSDVVLKLSSKSNKSTLLKFAGAWKDMPEMDGIFESISKERSKSGERNIDLKW